MIILTVNFLKAKQIKVYVLIQNQLKLILKKIEDLILYIYYSYYTYNYKII